MRYDLHPREASAAEPRRELRASSACAPLSVVDRSEVRAKWQGERAGERYASERWSSVDRRQRDPRLVASILARHLAPRAGAMVLDAPCGAGRLRPVLARHGRYVGLDVSMAMLAAARVQAEHGDVWLRGDLTRLPFEDSVFDAVVCCRLLHHLEPAGLEPVLAELVRVSRGLVVASFWDAHCLPAWRRCFFPTKRAPRRLARSRRELALTLERVGAEVLGWSHSLRFLTRQTFVLARKRSVP